MEISFKGTPISFEVTGEGKPVVLLHGLLESKEIWRELASSLSSKYKVITIDLPGHGDSGCLGYVHRMEEMADVVSSVMHHLRVKKAFIAGHSMGGYVTMALCEKNPELFRAACLFHSTAAADSEEKRKDRDRALSVIKENHRSFIESLIPNLFAEGNREKLHHEIQELKKLAARTSKQGLIAAIEGMKIRPDRTELLTQADFPFYFIIGKHDPVIPFEAILNQAKLPKAGGAMVLEDSGHMGFIEEKDLALKTITSFISSAYKNKSK